MTDLSPAPACRSMTGYASVQRAIDGWRIACELRSVNARFLDLSFRMPDDARSAEGPLRELLTARIGRGKIECRVALQAIDDGSVAGAPNPTVLRTLAQWQAQVRAALPDAAPLSVAEALRWPGVMADTAIDPDRLRDAIVDAVRSVLDAFEASRTREGARLAQAVLDRAARVAEIAQTIHPKLPALREAYRARASQRLTDVLGASAVEGNGAMSREEIAARLANEVTLYAMRADVDEELTRLETHVAEVRRVIAGQVNGSIGKRLDFLMQELHREANTLGSKAVVNELADASIELKLLIEQMREQVQNLE